VVPTDIPDTREKKEPKGYPALGDPWDLKEFRDHVEVKGAKDPRELRATWATRGLVESLG